MKKILFPACCLALMLSATSCTDYFLDLEPTDTQTEANYYKTAAQFQAAAYSTYSFYAFRDLTEKVNNTNYTHTIYNTWDPNTDMGSSYSEAAKGTLAAPTSDAYWSIGYAKIRKCNVVISKADEYTGTEDISASVGVAKFFRAYQYFWLLQRFGGVPIVTDVLSSSSEETYGGRNSRYEVVAQILADLDDAIAKLPNESAYDGSVTKQGAQAFKARVLLFEGTWEKYVGTTTDGDGTSSGAGSTKPAGYPSVESMLTEAASLAETVMNSGKYELMSAAGTVYEPIAYFYIFNLEDANTNPMGWTKSDNHEFILQVAYDHTSFRSNKNLTHAYGWDPASTIGGGTDLKWMLMAPCTHDGLPYFYSQDFKGFNKMNDIYTNRDYRLTSQMLIPGQAYYTMGTYGADATTYKSADYVTCFDFPNPMPRNTSITAVGATGYSMRKMTSERKDYGDTEESYNYPVLRLAEVYLIYAEAKCELGNGSISDADLDKSINRLHARAGVANINNASVAIANANYARNTGKEGTLTMLDLIRNERAIELICENQRGFDLMRWGIAEETFNNNNHLGMVIKNADGTDTEYVGADIAGSPCWTESVLIYGTETLPDGSVAYITCPKSQAHMSRNHYLNPLPTNQIQLNPALIQNPGF